MKLRKNLLVASSFALLFSVNLFAQDAYTIQNKTLKEALEIISKKSNLSYIANDKLLESQKTNNVKNIESLEETLKVLLKGTGLKAIIKNDAIVIVEEGAKENTNSSNLGEVDIVAKTTSDYLHNNEMKANRTKISLDDTAKSIQVFNEAFINDSQSQNIENIIEFSSNTVYTGNDHGRTTEIAMRGFSGVPILIDGLKITNAINSPDVFNFSTVEVQKGPDSLQYGKSSPGGIVNLAKKKPIKESLTKVELEVNDNPSYSTKVDLGGSLNKEESLYFRLVSTFTKDNGFSNSNTDIEGVFIAPSIAYDINDEHTLTFVAEYFDETSPSTFGHFVNSDGEIMGSSEETISNPNEEFKKTQKIVGFDLHSTFDTWNSNLKYRYIDYVYDADDVHMPFNYNETTNILTRVYAYQKQSFQENALQYTINKDIVLAGIEHKLSAGADYNKASSKLDMYFDTSTPYYLDLSNPSYEALTSLSDHASAVDYSTDKTYTESWGAFIQDNINLSDNLILNAGLRYSESTPKDGQKSDALSPSLGLVYKATPQTSIYANYSESFTPNTKSNVNGNILTPEEGKGFEIGVKQKLFDDRFSLTAAIFKIEKINVAIDDPNSVLTAYISSGEQHSKGFEIDLSGSITNELSLMASYGYTTTKDKDNNNNDLSNIPTHTANIFATYNLAKLNLPSIHIGAGARYIGSKYADTANSIELDSVIIYNTSIGYKKDNWQANLSIQNLSNEEYVDGSMSGQRVYLGDSRTVLAKVTYTF